MAHYKHKNLSTFSFMDISYFFILDTMWFNNGKETFCRNYTTVVHYRIGGIPKSWKTSTMVYNYLVVGNWPKYQIMVGTYGDVVSPDEVYDMLWLYCDLIPLGWCLCHLDDNQQRKSSKERGGQEKFLKNATECGFDWEVTESNKRQKYQWYSKEIQ